MKDYQPIWPETVVFWGAGARAGLGFRTTDQLGEALFMLAESNIELVERVGRTLRYQPLQESVIRLLVILGDESYQHSLNDILDTEYSDALSPDQRRARVDYLRRMYDWKTLRQLIHTCPGNSADSFQLQDLFNLIDMHLRTGQGFHVHESGYTNDLFIPAEHLIAARNALKMLIVLLFYTDYHQMIATRKVTLDQYAGFAEALYQLMVEEGIRFQKEEHALEDRGFYLFSYALISMNWDPMLLWFLFTAHNKMNNSPAVTHIGDPPQPIKMFHDMAEFMGVRQIGKDKPGVWYPFNETVVQRVNDTEHITSRRVRVGKFYFPHGCLGWRECPNCGKLVMYLGDDWQIDSSSLMPPHLIPSLSKHFKVKSKQEQNALGRGETDAIQCAFCGTLTELRHTPLIMQSNFKGEHPPFVEQIQRDMRVAVEQASHIVLMGYSLPSDDFIYRSLLAARKPRGNRERYCTVVGYSPLGENRWLQGTNLTDFVSKYPEESFSRTMKATRDIFGEKRVRGYACGIPQVFLSDDRVSEAKVKDLLYPLQAFPSGFVERRS